MGRKTRHSFPPERLAHFHARFNELCARLRGEDQNWANVAALFGMDQGHLSVVRRGAKQPTIQFVLQVCEHTNVTPNWLFGYTESEGGA